MVVIADTVNPDERINASGDADDFGTAGGK
jgi:hypothetical protein